MQVHTFYYQLRRLNETSVDIEILLLIDAKIVGKLSGNNK